MGRQGEAMRKLAIHIGIALGVMLLIFGVFMLWLFTPVYAGERCGRASWYGNESGNTTASGKPFHPGGMTFAMRSRGYGAVYNVTYQGRTIRAVHNDYGPARWTGREFDLAEGLAAALGLKRHGTGLVCISRVKG
jgi:rare lipoprotein A (peptidoglycan hydrolase)